MGVVAGLASAAIDAYEGEYGMAALSLASMVPGLGAIRLAERGAAAAGGLGLKNLGNWLGYRAFDNFVDSSVGYRAFDGFLGNSVGYRAIDNIASNPALGKIVANSAERYGGLTQRQALLNQVSDASSISEAKGVVHAFREMKGLGYQLEDVSLKYRGNQGLDLVFTKNSQHAIVEAKHGKYLSSLDTYKGGLRQGSLDYNISRLERYLDFGDGKNSDFANRLLNDAYSGQLESFATLYRGQSTYELPIGWPKNAFAIKR